MHDCHGLKVLFDEGCREYKNHEGTASRWGRMAAMDERNKTISIGTSTSMN